MSEPIYVGIDIAKASFELAMTGEAQILGLGNDEGGHAKLCQQLETTGDYDQVLALPLIAAGLCVSLINPRQARDSARCMGKLVVAYGSAINMVTTEAFVVRAFS